MEERVLEIVHSAVSELNEELEYPSLENISAETPIYGGPDSIDSLSLVRLVVALEGEIEARLHRKVSLSDARAMSQRGGPYRSVGSLVTFICSRLEDNIG